MLTVTTKEEAVYDFLYQDVGGNGERLSALRRTGPDDHDSKDAPGGPMIQRRWYRVSVLAPMPPRIGDAMTLVLEPPKPEAPPIVRHTSIVMSVVGTF